MVKILIPVSLLLLASCTTNPLVNGVEGAAGGCAVGAIFGGAPGCGIGAAAGAATGIITTPHPYYYYPPY
jgi:hypothetical protein